MALRLLRCRLLVSMDMLWFSGMPLCVTTAGQYIRLSSSLQCFRIPSGLLVAFLALGLGRAA